MPADEAPASVPDTPRGADLSTLVVAIDGPSGSGKSTVARGVARALGLRYLDTGAVYRALTWLVLDRTVDPRDVEAVLAVTDDFELQLSTDPEHDAVRVNATDVLTAIRGSKVTAAVSTVSAVPEVRQRMVAFQRSVIGAGGIVVEGRDIGTVVCPDSPVKIFLTASPEARAMRRSVETAQRTGGVSIAPNIAAVQADLARRDRLDSTRVSSPLTQAADALPLDSTMMDADDVIACVLDVVAARTRAHAGAAAPALDQIGRER
jgi:CMP/dCMP kinase